jgi:FKBP-type peptidyl-prolyl cis-trans isomerase FkpA
VWLCLIGVLGCAGSTGNENDPAPIARAPALPGEESSSHGDTPTKEVPLPELPAGAGRIDDDAPAELARTPSGLYYRILRKSDGRKPGKSDRVTVHYKGWLDNGTQFDSSYDRNEPITMRVDEFVEGWIEGLQLVGVGSMLELEVPAKLGYRDRPRPKIPANSTLHFVLELIEVH